MPLRESLDTTECINGEQRPGWDFVLQVDVNPHIMHMLEGTISLDTAHLFINTEITEYNRMFQFPLDFWLISNNL